jgi:hypothetical protein
VILFLLRRPTGEITPLRPEPEPKKAPVNPGLMPPWQAGESGNPIGRPRGSRNRLSESFLSDFHTVWEEEGLEAIRRCARNDPSTFVRIAASLAPHDINLNAGINANAIGVVANAICTYNEVEYSPLLDRLEKELAYYKERRDPVSRARAILQASSYRVS